MDLLKALPYDGGPSTTRWVVLSVAFVISLSSFILSCAIGYVYVGSADHHFDAALGIMVSGTFTAMFGFAANSLNRRNQLTGEKSDDNKP